MVELKLIRFDLNFNDKPIAKHLTQIANKCQKLKSIEIRFIMTSKNCEDFDDVMAYLRQFKRLRRLTLTFDNSNESKESMVLFSFKVFKGFENITHLRIGFSEILELFSEKIFTDIDINLPKLQYFKFDNDLDLTDWTVDILSKILNLQKINLSIILGNVEELESNSWENAKELKKFVYSSFKKIVLCLRINSFSDELFNE